MDDKRKDMPTITIYTDGACAGNPGRGGRVYVMIRDRTTTEASGAAEWTTNNQMELRAAIEALAALDVRTEVEVITDSQYVAIGITEWISE
jgi:ribonuclease HI